MIGRRIVVWMTVWLAVVAVLGVLEVAGVEVIDLFKDTIELRDEERLLPWKGALGAIGALGWVAGATSLLLAGCISRSPTDRRYLLTGGAVFVALGLDDALVVHDHLLPYMAGVDTSEEALLLALALAVAWWAVRFREQLAASDLVLLAMSALGLGGAFGIDGAQSLGLDLPGVGLVEEVSELLGLITVVAWAVSEARRLLPVSGADRAEAEVAASR